MKTKPNDQTQHIGRHCGLSRQPRWIERAISFYNELLVAAWMVNPKLPVRRFRPMLKQVGMVTLDSFGDPPVNRMHPLSIPLKYLLGALSYPFRYGANVLRVAAILREIERNGAASARPKVAVKFQQVFHVRHDAVMSDSPGSRDRNIVESARPTSKLPSNRISMVETLRRNRCSNRIGMLQTSIGNPPESGRSSGREGHRDSAFRVRGPGLQSG